LFLLGAYYYCWHPSVLTIAGCEPFGKSQFWLCAGPKFEEG
jgi:hypothetical protein